MRKVFDMTMLTTAFLVVWLIAEIVSCHKAATEFDLNNVEKLFEVSNLPYSLDVTFCDMYLLQELKKYLANRKYHKQRQLKSALVQCRYSIPQY